MLAVLFSLFIIFIIIGTPIAFAIGLATFGALSTQDNVPLLVVVQRFFTTLDSFSLVAIPLFMLAGEIMTQGRLIEKLISFAASLVGHIRGGFAQVTVMTSVMLSGISGSAAADTAAVGSVMIPAMKKEKYDPGFAVALTSSSSIIAPIIPPSIMMIIFGSLAGVSIGQLFMAGILPGILLAIALMIYSYFYARKHNVTTLNKRVSLKELWSSFKKAIWVLFLPLIIVGGIRFGVFSPTEAAAIAVLYALILALFQRTLSIKKLPKIFLNAAVLSTMSLMIMAAASAFSWLLASQMFPQMAVNFITSFSENPTVVFLLLMVILLVIGLFIEASAALIILIPVLVGIQSAFQFDPVHFGVVVILTLVIGGVTPPVGNLLFIAAGIGKVKISDVFWKIWPLVGIMLLVTIILILFPELVTFLPEMMRN